MTEQQTQDGESAEKRLLPWIIGGLSVLFLTLAFLLSFSIYSHVEVEKTQASKVAGVASKAIRTVGGSCKEWVGSKTFKFTLKKGKPIKVLFEHCFGKTAKKGGYGVDIWFNGKNDPGACYTSILQNQDPLVICRGDNPVFSGKPRFTVLKVASGGPINIRAILTP